MASLSSLLAVVSGVLILVGACYLLATKQRPAVLGAYLVLVPLPVLISLCGLLNGIIASLTVIGSSDAVVSTADVATATAASLLELLVTLVVSAPTYFVLVVGLLLRTLQSQPTPPVPPQSPLSVHFRC